MTDITFEKHPDLLHMFNEAFEEALTTRPYTTEGPLRFEVGTRQNIRCHIRPLMDDFWGWQNAMSRINNCNRDGDEEFIIRDFEEQVELVMSNLEDKYVDYVVKRIQVQ